MPQAKDEAGNIWEVDAQGNPVRLLAAAGTPQGGVYTLPQSAEDMARESRANASDRRAETQLQLSIAAAERAAKSENKPPIGYKWTPQGMLAAIPGGPADKQNKPSQALRQGDSDHLRKLGDNLVNLQSLGQSFQDNYGGNLFGGLENTAQGLASGIGTPGQRQWWSEMDTLDNLIRNGLFGASLTAGEKEAYARTSVKPNMDPKEIRNNLTRRLEIMQGAANRYTNALKVGGWNPAEIDALVPPQAPEQKGIASGKTRNEYSPELSRKVDALVNSGASKEEIDAILGANGFPPIDPGSFNAARDWMAKNPGKPYSGANINRTVDNSLMERFAGSGVGAALIGAGNAGSLGAVQAMAPDDYQAIAGARPLPTMLGGALGALAGTGLVGKAGASVAGKVAPKLLGGNGIGQFGRNLATDVAYGGIYGGMTEGDPLKGAVYGGISSGIGQGLGTGIAKTIGGGTLGPTLSRLREQGITPTMGQSFRANAADRGGRSLIAGIEDVVGNTGAVGSVVNGARNRALEEANTAAYRIAGDGAPITGIGDDALEQLTTVKDGAYSTALDGRTLPLDDPKYIEQLADARSYGEAVDAARGRGDYQFIADNQLAPVVSGEVASGKQVQNALRLLQGQRRAYNRAATGLAPDPAAANVADALGRNEDALVSLAARSNPDMIPDLKRANRINRNLLVLDDAAGRSINDGGVFTGVKLGQAIKASQKALGSRGLTGAKKSELYQLQQDMQTALPNEVPPTGVNVAPMLALGGAGLYGTGEATDSSTLSTLGMLGLLATPYTKTGQKAVDKLLFSRPEKMRDFSKLLLSGQRKGLFGAGATGGALTYAGIN